MLVRTIIALVSSPFYGVLIALATLPILVIGGIAMGLLSIASLILPLILIALSFVLQAAVYAQSARYAASMTGLKSLMQQPEFFRSVGRSLAVTIIVGIVSGIVIVAFFIVFLKFGGAEQFWWMDREKLGPAVQAAMESPAAAEEIFSFENMNLGTLVFIIQAFSMFFVTLIALFVIPRAIDLGDRYHRTYTLGLVLTRWLIAFPFCAAMADVVARLLLVVVQAALDIFADGVTATTLILYSMQMPLFTGMIFAFEAFMLKTGHEHSEEEEFLDHGVERADTEEIRALRDAWNQRT